MRPAVFTIASDLPFLDALVAGLLAQTGHDPLALARQTVLLPTRRASRALREAFLRASGGKALLLPRLVPVGDVDAEELVFLGEDAAGEASFDIPPAVPELRRPLLLTRLVLGWGRARGRRPLTAGQAEPGRRRPPRSPTIAAGIPGGVAAVADLLAVVAGLPNGAVVLPDIDRAIDAESWSEIAADPAHPQHLPARLLRRLEIEPADLRPWPAATFPGGRSMRRRLVADAFRPAEIGRAHV